MLKSVKKTALAFFKASGLLHAARSSRWRQRRLLILAYHGVAVNDEDHWNPGLYMSAAQLGDRFQLLQEGGYNVLGLEEAVSRLYSGDLPGRSVVLTFDDGMYDFYRAAWPVLQRYQFPATVYLTTYYSEYNRPIFRLICSYMLWKKREARFGAPGFAGLTEALDMTPACRVRTVAALDRFAKVENLSGPQKDELAGALAAHLGIDYQELLNQRILQVMNSDEVRALANSGVDIQLHTHRHRTPRDRDLFVREIDDNQRRIAALTGTLPVHFCYPSGVHHAEFPRWLEERQIVSATTCDHGMADRASNRLLLPRLLDHGALSDLEFESWLSGVGPLLPRRPMEPKDPEADDRQDPD